MKKVGPVIVLIVLSIFSIRPLLMRGYFPMHDDTQVSRVIEMGRALKEGQFPVRWVSDLGYGYGYPIFNFYAPLPYYFGGLLYAFGLPALTATKLMFAAGVLAPALTLYAVLVGMIGWQAALVASLFFLYAPYHAVQIYVRGAVGEYWVLLFWPLLIASMVIRPKKSVHIRSIVLGSIGLSGAMLSHTLLGYVTVLFFCITLGVYWGIRFVKRNMDWSEVRLHGLILFLGLGLSAFFWLPAVSEMKFTSVSAQIGPTADYRDHFVCAPQLWSSLWGFGGSIRGCIDGLSFMLGKFYIVLAGISTLLWMSFRPTRSNALFFIGLGIAMTGIFFSLEVSGMIWGQLPFFAYLQYPWRFLAFASFGLSVLAGLLITFIKKEWQKTFAAFVTVFVLIWFGAKWFVPQYLYATESRKFEEATDLRWRVSKISDEYLPLDLPRPESETEVASDTMSTGSGYTVSIVEETAVLVRAVVATTKPTEIVIRKAYFPGWQYSINDIKVVPTIRHGLPVLTFNPGQSIFEMKFTDTPVRVLGNIISLASLMVLGGIIYASKKAVR